MKEFTINLYPLIINQKKSLKKAIESAETKTNNKMVKNKNKENLSKSLKMCTFLLSEKDNDKIFDNTSVNP